MPGRRRGHDPARPTTLGFYGEEILPRLLNWGMSGEEFRKRRSRALAPVAGRVLEIGFGSGLNLPHYGPEVRELLAVDPAHLGRKLARARLAEAPFPVTFLEEREGALDVGTGEVDAVVTTWTLCTVPDASTTLREVARVLAPGGRFVFVEHGASPDAAVRRWQERLEPLQRRLFGGCRLTRPIERLVRESPLELVEVDHEYLPGPRPLGYLTFGTAVREA